MTVVVKLLVGVVVILAGLVAVGLVIVLRTVRPLRRGGVRQAADVADPAFLAEKDRQEQSLAAVTPRRPVPRSRRSGRSTRPGR